MFDEKMKKPPCPTSTGKSDYKTLCDMLEFTKKYADSNNVKPVNLTELFRKYNTSTFVMKK